MKCFYRNRCFVIYIIYFEGYLFWGRYFVLEKDLEIVVYVFMYFKILL